MPEFDVQRELDHSMTAVQTRRYERALRDARLTSQDFPLLPTSDTNAQPTLELEAGDNLTPAQRLAVAAIISGETFVAAARAANVSRRTLYQWRQTHAFKRAVEGRSREALDVVVIRVRNLMLRATRVLGETLLDEAPGRASASAIRVLNSSRLWAVARAPADETTIDEATVGEATHGRPDAAPATAAGAGISA